MERSEHLAELDGLLLTVWHLRQRLAGEHPLAAEPRVAHPHAGVDAASWWQTGIILAALLIVFGLSMATAPVTPVPATLATVATR
jgi:hypothetical protein